LLPRALCRRSRRPNELRRRRAGGRIRSWPASQAVNSAYVCVYRHFFPSTRDIVATQTAAVTDPKLLRFLALYPGASSFYDWGDDPSFYSALCTQGDPAFAGWGVCRPDVRQAVVPGDLVVFFCAKRQAPRARTTDYYFIGVGTVQHSIQNRSHLWSKPQFRFYRSHYNVLARPTPGGLVQHETFHPYHDNWMHRASRPYVIFDPNLSKFNLSSPILVSTSTNGATDIWNTNRSRRVNTIEHTLFRQFGITRRLRTSPTGNAHRHLNLTKHLRKVGTSPSQLRVALIPLI